MNLQKIWYETIGPLDSFLHPFSLNLLIFRLCEDLDRFWTNQKIRNKMEFSETISKSLFKNQTIIM